MTAPIKFKYNGITAEQMNYKASVGLANKRDLETWASIQNNYVVSIKWKVGETDHYVTNKFCTTVPYLYSVKLY